MAALPGANGDVLVLAAQAVAGTAQLFDCTTAQCVPLGAAVPAAAPAQIVVSPSFATDHTVVIQSGSNAYLSIDGGRTLRALLGGAAGNVTSMALTNAPTNPTGLPTIVAAVQRFEGTTPVVALMRSSDGGASFTPAGAAALSGVAGVDALVGLPGDLVVASVVGSTEHLDGIRCSADGGVDWAYAC
jgi:hypothetical protein